MGFLRLGQLGLGSGRFAPFEGVDTFGLGAGNPLTDRPLRGLQSQGDVFLFPALLIKFPGVQATPFPSSGVRPKRGSFHTGFFHTNPRL